MRRFVGAAGREAAALGIYRRRRIAAAGIRSCGYPPCGKERA
jgi:hypothetical protein